MTDALAHWAGFYVTETQWWDGFFSPLVVDRDGAVELAGTTLTDVSFEGGVLRFGPHEIQKTIAHCEDGIRFEVRDGTY